MAETIVRDISNLIEVRRPELYSGGVLLGYTNESIVAQIIRRDDGSVYLKLAFTYRRYPRMSDGTDNKSYSFSSFVSNDIHASRLYLSTGYLSPINWTLSNRTVTFTIDIPKPEIGKNLVKFFNNSSYRTPTEEWYVNANYTSGTTSSVTFFLKSPVKIESSWYNSSPTITLTNPTDSQTLAEGNTMLVSGEASDADSGNVLTVKYKINNGTARAIASGVSDGSTPISFARTLTYSGKRLYDGAVDVAGADLAENTDHTLTVWAEDDKGGKSAEVTRKFRVVWNRPPTISGENGDLGIMEAPPSVEYTVTDPETNPFTITEKINGEVIRTFAGAAGQQETVTIPPDMWLRLEPGVPHSLTIEASDDQGMTSMRTYTLTRFVDKIVFSLDFATMQQETKDFFTTDVAAKRLLLTPIWDLPPGAILLVEVCNNAYDEEPSWEDATIVVKLNRAHLFANETKTAAEWGINFRFQIEKGSATQPIYLKGVGGAFD